MKNTALIKKLYKHFDNMGFCVFTDEDFELLYIHHGLACVVIEKKSFSLSFEVTCEPLHCAIITQEVIQFASKHKMKVHIFEPYADVTDEEGMVKEVLFGEDAIYYHETGEVPIKAEETKKEMRETKIDVEKKVDTILDQISTKGMKSLKKEQKEFLMNYSKGKNEHKH